MDDLQRCVDMIEALALSQDEVKNFRTHCHDIIGCAQILHPVLLKAQKDFPDIKEADGASQIFRKVYGVLEEALLVIRKASAISQIEKFMDRGETKGRLEDILTSMQSAAKEVDAFVVDFLQKSRAASDGSHAEASAEASKGKFV